MNANDFRTMGAFVAQEWFNLFKRLPTAYEIEATLGFWVAEFNRGNGFAATQTGAQQLLVEMSTPQLLRAIGLHGSALDLATARQADTSNVGSVDSYAGAIAAGAVSAADALALGPSQVASGAPITPTNPSPGAPPPTTVAGLPIRTLAIAGAVALGAYWLLSD